MSDSPSPQPTPDRLEELMSGYILNALSPEEIAEIEQHLRTNPESIEQLRQLQEVMGYLAYPSRTRAPAGLRSKILAIPHSSSSTATNSGRLPRRSFRGSLDRWHLGTAIAALLLLALGIDNVLLRQRLTSLETSVAELHERQENYAFTLKGTSAAMTASAKVIVDADVGEVIVGAQNLPPLPKGEAYHLWAFTANQTRILCGQFNTDPSGQFVDRFSVSPDVYTSPIQFMRISREPLVASPNADRRVLVLTSES